MLNRTLTPFLLAAAATLAPAQVEVIEVAAEPPVNALTRAEQAAGWHLAFDGKTSTGWRGYRKEAFPEKGWAVDQGTLHLTRGGGDIMTTRKYGNFELRLQWKVSKRANSGIMYRVSEHGGASYMTGPEYQILDDPNLRVGEKQSAGALYGLYAPGSDKKLKPTGAWNTARIVLDGDRLEHWLNGVKIVEAKWGSKDWKERIAGSKFKRWKRFGQNARGHICLQDHGNEVWYRDIKIRELDPSGDRLGEPVDLFDGKDLDGWDAHLRKNAKIGDVWSVDGDGNLICKGRPIGYIHTTADYESFVLELEWRFNPVTKKAGNSGVLFRMIGEHKVWPRSIEAQLMSRNAGDFWNIGSFPMSVTASRTRGRNTKKTHGNENPVGEWNKYRIVADGPWVRLSVNGEVLNEAWDCKVVPGKICLQSEGAEIHFRNIRLFPLKR